MTLRLDNVEKEFGKNDNYQKVLDNISIEFKSGEFVCILGESGSGKSTLLNILGGLDTSYNGSVTMNNLNLKYIDIDDYRKENIGFIFQNFNLINSLSIIDNIILPLDKYNISYKEKRKRALELLKKLNIYNIRKKKINDLSGGQKQRIAIARALINNPSIILADEPTGALDEKNSISVLEILKEINKEGKLVIVVTHSEKVIDYSTRVVTIKDGKIDSDKKLKRVKETYIDKYELKENNFLYLIKYGIRNIFNNKKRNIFITLASSIGIIGIILSLFIGNSVKKYMSDLILDKSNPNIYSITNKNNNMYETKYYEKKEINKIKNIDHIDKIYKGITYNMSKLKIDEKEYNLTYIDSFNEIDLDKGNDKGLVISNFLAKLINKNVNKVLDEEVTLTIIDNYNVIEIDIPITGISKKSNISLVDDTMHGFISYKYLEDIYKDNDLELKPNNISIEIDDNKNIDLVKNDLNKLDLTASNNSDLYDELKSYLNIATFVLSMFSSLSLIVSVIMISIIINITVLERTKEIGLLRSIGYTKKDIKYIFNSEAIFLGTIIGIFASIISKHIINLIKEIVSNKFDISFNINANKYFIFGIWLSIVLTLLSSYFPSKKASNYDPIKSLKYE